MPARKPTELRAADTAPCQSAAAVVPSDGADLPFITRSLYVGGSGDISVVMADGGAAVFKGALAGSYLPLSVARVMATGTTATNLVAMY